MQVKSIAECSKGSILQYFEPSLSYHLSLRSCFVYFEWPFYTGFTVNNNLQYTNIQVGVYQLQNSTNEICNATAQWLLLVLKIYFRNTIKETNSLYPDQARHFVRPDLSTSISRRKKSPLTDKNLRPIRQHKCPNTFMYVTYSQPS